MKLFAYNHARLTGMPCVLKTPYRIQSCSRNLCFSCFVEHVTSVGNTPIGTKYHTGTEISKPFKILRYFEIQMFFIQSFRLGHVSPFDWKFLKNWNTKSQGPKKILPILQEGGSSPTHSTCNKGSFTPYRVGLSNPLISQLYTNV